MMEFTQSQCILRPCREFLALGVPGLAEGRPSLLVGDSVVLFDPCAVTDAPCFEGYVHEVHREEIMLKFQEDFHLKYDNQPYDVMFKFNRYGGIDCSIYFF